MNAMHSRLQDLGHVDIERGNMTITPDVILVVGLDAEDCGLSAEQAIMYKMMLKSKKDVKVVLRVNENDARKGTDHVDHIMRQAAGFVDGTVFVSEYIRDYFMAKGWECKDNVVIYNGVDKELFAPSDTVKTQKTSIVAHHWSDNYMKGFDVYDMLDEFVGTPEGAGFSFTYIGRQRGTFKNTTVINPISARKLGIELSRHDVYVSGSRHDPGPNHVLEALACGLPTWVHKDGGGAVEFAGKEFAFDDCDHLKSILVEGKWRVTNNVILDDWNTCIDSYLKYMEHVIDR